MTNVADTNDQVDPCLLVYTMVFAKCYSAASATLPLTDGEQMHRQWPHLLTMPLLLQSSSSMICSTSLPVGSKPNPARKPLMSAGVSTPLPL